MRAAVGLALGQPVEAVEAVKGHVEAAEALALVPWRIWVIAQASKGACQRTPGYRQGMHWLTSVQGACSGLRWLGRARSWFTDAGCLKLWGHAICLKRVLNRAGFVRQFWLFPAGALH